MVIFGILDYYDNWLKINSNKTEANQKPHIITTNVEHDAIFLPIKHLEKKGVIGNVYDGIIVYNCMTSLIMI